MLMFSHNIYIVASTKNVRDVHIENVYDGDMFTLDTIIAGFKDKLKSVNHQVSVVCDNAYIDIVDQNNELVKTYSIISKQVLLKKD